MGRLDAQEVSRPGAGAAPFGLLRISASFSLRIQSPAVARLLSYLARCPFWLAQIRLLSTSTRSLDEICPAV